MKRRTRDFEQYLYHGDEGVETNKYLEETLPLIGDVVFCFNTLEQELNNIICRIINDRSDSVGLLIIHKMSYSSKVDLFKRFTDDFENGTGSKIIIVHELIQNLKECAKLRNIVVHADWFSTDIEGYTFINVKISEKGIKQEYIQFSKESLEKIIDLIISTKHMFDSYENELNSILAK